jgi:DNA-binding CsgD family transcriptional regulator
MSDGAVTELWPDPRAILSSRELEVLEMASLGLTNWEIARRLGVTVHAIKFHLAGIYRKLGVTNRTEAAVALLRAQSLGGGAGERTDAA